MTTMKTKSLWNGSGVTIVIRSPWDVGKSTSAPAILSPIRQRFIVDFDSLSFAFIALLLLLYHFFINKKNKTKEQN